MTSEINELLGQRVTCTQQLSDTSDEAMTAIDGMVKNAEALTERVREEAPVVVQPGCSPCSLPTIPPPPPKASPGLVRMLA
jgi:hypothetical protein